MQLRKPQVSDPQGSEVVSQISSKAGSVLDYEDGLLKVAHDLYEYPAKHYLRGEPRPTKASQAPSGVG